jgi:manganese/zinc/iron transport system permease protein
LIGYQWEILAIAAVTACACALPGSFLVLRQSAMLSDAVSHAVLPGIVVAFLLTGSLTSPLLVLGAAATGVLTVSLVELLRGTRLLREDAAIGLTFPVLFSIGVVLVSRYAGSVHLDTDAVLLGELAFAPFRRVGLGGHDLGPEALWTMSAVLVLNLAFVTGLFKELQLVTFDPALGAALGFSPSRLHYALMALVSLTAVGAFDAVGSVLVVALMVAPPAAARLLTDRLSRMLLLSALIGIGSAGLGWLAAHRLDASIAGCMASTAGAVFAIVFLLAPETGLMAQARRRAERRRHFRRTMLVIHLFQHGDSPQADDECRVDRLHLHLRWEESTVSRVVREAQRAGEVRRAGALLVLTSAGRTRAEEGIAG